MTSNPCFAVTIVSLLAIPGGALRADTPTALVTSGVTDYSLSDPKVFWHTAADCPLDPPKSPVGPAGDDDEAMGGGGSAADPEVITRVPSYGGMKRKLFEKNPSRPAGKCNPYHFYSDIAADASHVYWVDSTGLVRLPVEANVGDPVEVLNATITGADNLPRAEIAMGTTSVYVLRYVTATKGDIFGVSKADGTRTLIWHLEQHCSRLSFDGQYVFYKPDSSSLFFRVNVTDHSSTTGLSTGDGSHGASSLWSEGLRGRPPLDSHYVFVGHGPKLYRYNILTATPTGPIYTSTDANASIFTMTGDSSYVYFFEARPFTCPGCIFPTYTQLLFRRPQTGNGAAELLYSRESQSLNLLDVSHLTTDGKFLYWQEAFRVMRLPSNAAELPKTNMRVTDIEVTQGIQDLTNSVPLIDGKRTFARVYVESDGPDVSGVTAWLYATWTGGGGGPVGPSNTNSQITVYSFPVRDNLDDSFYFQLPWDWIGKPNLRLRAELNPNKVPIQESYANNSLTVGPFTFKASPRLEVQFIVWEFDWAGKRYTVDYEDHVLPTYSWIRRAYPLASSALPASDPGPGFRPRLRYVFDEDLGAEVDRSSDDCAELLTNDDPKDDDQVSLCASAYTNSKMQAMQAEYGDDVFYYGMISDEHKFPRGQASGKTSSGPVGDACCGAVWDTDGTYSDWYAGHEIGHTLGRGHPIKESDDPDTKDVTEGCGHDSGDPNYPYEGAKIGPGIGSLEGFDMGDAYNKPAVLPQSIWTDLMSYCDYQWISDYTYKGMYDTMAAGSGGAQAQQGGGGGVAGDFLSAFGVIFPDSNKATLHHVRRLASVGRIPARRPGAYELVLCNAQGARLAGYAFEPSSLEDGGQQSSLGFGLIVPFAPGARQLKISRVPGGQVLAIKSISSSPPVVSNVALQGAPNPVSGVVTLGWTASDPDGDKLCFDILYSNDAGASFAPVLLNVKTLSAPIDSSRLAGGAGKFRVTATDGVHTASADSPSYNMSRKGPVPRIVLPEQGTRVHWGTLVNFAGEADDLEDGSVAPAGLTWFQGRTLLGTGPLLSMDNLKVGENIISLQAVDSDGMSASASVIVIVDDDLTLPGPTLTAGPSKIGWHVGAGSIGSVTAQIGISNAGSGILNWTASEGAPWLTLSATSGSAPDLITVTAVVTGIAGGTTLAENIVISGPAGQSVTIPITLSVGDTYSEPVGPGSPGGFKRGDSNGSGGVDISDAINTLGYLFGGSGTVACLDAADANDDGKTDISDAVATLGFLFLGLAPPPAPGPINCGFDPTADPQTECGYDPSNC